MRVVASPWSGRNLFVGLFWCLSMQCFQRPALETPFKVKDLSCSQGLSPVFRFSRSWRHLPFAFLHFGQCNEQC